METLAFGPLVVAFDDAVLRPRLWTLAQSDWAAELAAAAPPGPILELASGAGHIGQAAAILTGRALVQIDRNPAACAWAQRNAASAGIADRVDVRCASFADGVAAGESVPLVIADPPYVPTAEINRFPEDPAIAIDGGANGLELVRACLDVAAACLDRGGSVVLQVRGEQQASGLAALCRALSIVEIRTYADDRALVHLGT